MSEIKFRGISTETGKWVYGNFEIGYTTSSGFHCIGSYIIEHRKDDDGYEYFKHIEVKPETVGQYTGLKDKNGIEIYRGDIVKYRSHPHKMITGEVIYHEQYARYLVKHDYQVSSTGRSTWNFSFFGSQNYLEVIGNIHLNPELIDGR